MASAAAENSPPRLPTQALPFSDSDTAPLVSSWVRRAGRRICGCPHYKMSAGGNSLTQILRPSWPDALRMTSHHMRRSPSGLPSFLRAGTVNKQRPTTTHPPPP